MGIGKLKALLYSALLGVVAIGRPVIAAECGPSDIIGPRCAGSWAYHSRIACTEVRQDKDCGVATAAYTRWDRIEVPDLRSAARRMNGTTKKVCHQKEEHFCPASPPCPTKYCMEAKTCSTSASSALSAATRWQADTRAAIEQDMRAKGHDPAGFRFDIPTPSVAPVEGQCAFDWQAQVNVNASLQRVDVPATYKTCALETPPGNRSCAAPEWSYSTLGLARAQIDAAGAHPDGLKCLTCDDVPIDRPSAIAQCLREQLTAFDGTSPPPVSAAVHRQALVAKAETLFELRYSDLASLTMSAAPGSYAQDFHRLFEAGGAVATCGPHLTLPAGCPASAPALRQLELCLRLSSAATQLDAGRAELAACIGLRPALEALPASCDRPRLAEIQRTATLAILRRWLASPPSTENASTGPQPTIPELTARVRLLRSYYEALRSAEPSRERLFGELSALLADLWRSAYDAGGWGSSQNELDLQKRSVETERRVVLAALGTSQPELRGVPLLLVLADGLRGLTTGARNVGAVHDLGCRLLACKSPQAEVELFWWLIATIGTGAPFDQARAALEGSGNKPVLGPWVPVFAALAQQPALIAEARTDATAPGTSSLVPIVLDFEAMTTEARTRWSSFTRTGFLDFSPLADPGLATAVSMDAVNGGATPPNASVLASGLDRQRLTAKRAEFESRRGDFGSRLEQYRTRNLDVLRQWKEDLALGGKLHTLSLQAETTEKLIAFAVRDIEGQRAGAEAAAVRMAAFSKEFEAAIKASAAAGDFSFASSKSYSVAGTDAHYHGTLGLDAIAVQDGATPVRFRARRGDLLRFDVGGSWSPTCAVRNASLPGPNGAMRLQVDQTARIGSDGFTVNFTQGTYRAEAKSARSSDQSSEGDSIRGSVCMGGEARLGPSTPLGSAQVYVKAEGCVEAHLGHDVVTAFDESASAGSESRRAFSGITGLRVGETPFPDQPAGSLVVAWRAKNGTVASRVVLSPYAAIAVQEDADYYLVVNDKAGCTDISPLALSVRVTTMRGIAGQGAKLSQAMLSALAVVDAAAPGLMEQGELLPSQIAAIRSDAVHVLGTSFGTPYEQVPATLRAMFEAFLESRLVELERAVKIQANVRTLEVRMLELKSLANSVATEQDQSRVSQSMARALLQNIDGLRLGHTTGQVMGYVRGELVPIFDLRFPRVLERLRNEYASNLRALQAVDLGSNGLAIAEAVKVVVDAVYTVWQSELASMPTQPESLPVALGILRPGKTSVRSSNAKNMDPVRAATFWAALTGASPELVLEVRPDDLYRRSGGEMVLGCRRGNPVIEDLRLVFLTSLPTAQANTIDVTFGRDFTFVSDKGVAGYVIGRDDIRYPQLPLVFTETMNRAAADNTVMYAGAGLSPFTRIIVPLDVLRSPGLRSALDQATEAVLLFRLSYLQLAADVRTPSCQN